MPKRDSTNTNLTTTITAPTNDQVIVRHSEIADFRQCPLKWWLKWVQKWNPTDSSEASNLGTAWHAVMAAHYRTLQDPDLGADVGGNAWDAIKLYEKFDWYDRLVWMYEGYCEKHGLDEEWGVLDYEATRHVQILPGVLYEWTTDLLVLNHRLGKVQVVDHKSTSRPLRKIDTDLSDQLGLYINGEIRRGHNVVDGWTNQVRTEKLKRHMTLDERFARIPTYKSPVELDNIWYDAQRTTIKMLEMRAESEMPHSNPDPRVCSWKCDYVEAHLILRKTPRSKWDTRLGPLMRTKGMVQKEVPRGSDVPI